MNRVAKFLSTIGVEPDSVVARDLRNEALQELVEGVLQEAERRNVVWLNRPDTSDRTTIRAAANSERKSRPALSPSTVDLRWSDGEWSFVLQEVNEKLLLSCTVGRPDLVSAIPEFTTLYWFNLDFALKQRGQDRAEWEVAMPVKSAQLLVSRARDEVARAGDAAVMPWVS
jgi:hypothetical protein